MLIPREKVPNIDLPTTDGGSFNLSKSDAKNFNLIIFFRGLHCPLCALYLKDLNSMLDKFTAHGVKAVAISSDPKDRAEEFAKKVDAHGITFAYDFPLSEAKKWGLYISEGIGKTSIGVEELSKFPEPGLFLIKPDMTLYYGAVQTMPFSRPPFKDLLLAVEFAITKNYPARGEYTGSV